MRLAADGFQISGVCHAAADLKAIGCEAHAVGKQVGPRQHAVLFVRHFQHAHGAWRAYAAAGGAGIGLRCAGGRCGAHPLQVVLSGSRRRGFAAVVAGELFGGGVVVQHERAAA
jgi:hypothetical protein